MKVSLCAAYNLYPPGHLREPLRGSTWFSFRRTFPAPAPALQWRTWCSPILPLYLLPLPQWWVMQRLFRVRQQRLLIAFSHSPLHNFNPSRIAISFCLCCHAQRSAAIDWMFSLCSATSRVVSITSRFKKSFLTGLLGQALLLSRLFLWWTQPMTTPREIENNRFRGMMYGYLWWIIDS